MENSPKGPEDNKTIRNVLERWAPASLRSKVVAVLYSSGLTGDVTELSALIAALLILYNQKQSVMDDDSRQPHQKSLA